MQSYNIYRDNSIVYQFNVEDTISESLKGNKYVSFTINSKEELDIRIGDYILSGSEKYELFETIDMEESGGVFIYPLTFYWQGYKLNNSVITDEGATTFSYHGEVSDLMNLLIESLNVDYPEFTLGTIENTSIIDLSFDNSNCMAALQTICEAADMEWDIVGTTINVKKRIGVDTEHVFQYGKNKGSYSVKLSKIANTSITTRMIGKGGTLNLPKDYESPDSPKRLNLGGQVLEKNVDKYGKITGVYTNENIYPRLIDKTVLAVTVPENIKEAASWKIKLDIPFNLSDYYADDEVPVVKFQTGDLAGNEFEIVENSWNNTDKTLSIIVKEEDDYYLPNEYRQPRVGDIFVLLNIYMPQSYIDEATEELRIATQEELDKKCEPQYAPSLSIQKHYIKKKNISLHIGDSITLKIGRKTLETRILSITQSSTSDEISVELGDETLYSYDTKINNIIEQIQTTLRNVANIDDFRRLFNSLINAWYPKWFNQKLHKDADVQFNSVQSDNFSSKNFTSGPLGSGHRIKDGNAEFQNVTVRGRISAFEYLIQQVKAVGGKLLISAASMKAGVVEELEDGYKCYFNTDGGTIHNQFVVNDQAFHQVFNGQKQSRYWRLVTEVGSDYIVLSKTDCETGSDIPAVDDEILLLGNRTDINRMSAIILSAYDENSPYTAYYSGINSFSLDGKESMREGNLTGIVDKDFGQLAGFGLFANNVFLKGQFWLMSGKTVEQSITDGVHSGINGLDVGTRNLLKNRQEIITSVADFPDYSNYEVVENNKGENEVSVTTLLTSDDYKAYRYKFIHEFLTEPIGKSEYVFSFDYKTNSDGCKIQIDIRHPLIVYMYFAPNTNGEWRRGWILCDFRGMTTQTSTLFIAASSYNIIGSCITYRNLKLVKGNKGWDDSNAPEDTQKQFAELKVGVDGITSTVKSFKEELEQGIGGRNLAIYNTCSFANMYLDGETFKTTNPDTRNYFNFKVNLYNGYTIIGVNHSDGTTTLGRHYLKFRTTSSVITRMAVGHNGSARDCLVYFTNTLFKPNTDYVVGLDLVKFEGGDIQFKNVKIEEGTIPTTFVQSPEDMESESKEYTDSKNGYKNVWKGWIDATGLDQNTYYPVTMEIPPSYGKATIKVEAVLYESSVPSWATHSGGFSVSCEWTAFGNGWGTQAIYRVINSFTYGFSYVIPIGSITQLNYSSQEVIYVRGGGKYYFTCFNTYAPVLRTTSYTWTIGKYSQSAPLLTSVVAPSPTVQSQITQLSDSINLKVSKGDIINQINVSTDGVQIDATKLNINGVISANGNFMVDTNGNLTANNATLTGKITATSGKIAGFSIVGNTLQTTDEGYDIKLGSTTLNGYKRGIVVTSSYGQYAIVANASGGYAFYSDYGRVRIPTLVGKTLVITGNTTLTGDEVFVISKASSSITINLYSINPAVGQVFFVRKSGSGNITIQGTIQSGYGGTMSSYTLKYAELHVFIWTGSYWAVNNISGVS